MGAIKGYSSSKKSEVEKHDFSTLQPIGLGRYAVDVVSFSSVVLVAADAAEALSTVRQIVATSHAALKGMVIEFTSGAASGEIATVVATDTNQITLGQELSAAPGAGDTFEIFKYALSKTTSTGSITVVTGTRATVELVRNNYASVNVTTAAYVELIASTSGAIGQLHIFDSSGETLVLAVGAAASEVDQVYVPPGGYSAPIDLGIPAGSRVSIKAVSANATLGEIAISALS